ncbi:MAG: squalene/phytoene synthase family protein [Marinobacter sp.]|nr:squalene/phytoene synthase family protein [Marinobacter sp.]
MLVFIPGAGVPGVVCSAGVVERLVARAFESQAVIEAGSVSRHRHQRREMTDSVAETTRTATGADVLRRKGKSFYWAGQLLTAEQLESAAGLYQICRSIDDLADEASTPAQAMAADRQLGEFHQALMSRPTLTDEKPQPLPAGRIAAGRTSVGAERIRRSCCHGASGS